MVRIAVAGATGRMGRTIIGLLPEFPGLKLTVALEKDGHPELGREAVPGTIISAETAKLLPDADVLIDFTAPEAALENLALCRQFRKAAVIGTTGFNQAQLAEIKAAAEKIPVFISPNMSVGVNLLFRLAAEASRHLPEYEVEIVETHHDQKKDAPSGTALKLAEIIAATRNKELRELAVYGRQGRPGPRKPTEIGIHAIRLADVVGEHTVIFGTGGERLELTHKAGSRQSFARGALKAALFLAGQKPGFYSMEDILNGKKSRASSATTMR